MLTVNLSKPSGMESMGKQASFWLKCILMSLEMFICLIVLFKKTIFFLCLFGWEQSVPLAFALNKTNYARYGSYYVNSLENMDSTHPGCSESIAVKGLSVQGQDKYPCRTAVDQRGEQTIN